MSLTKEIPLSYFILTNEIKQGKQKQELKGHVVGFGIFETRITENNVVRKNEIQFFFC